MSDVTIGELCGDISVDAMMGDLAEFARRVKLSGTPEELESFRYIQSRLDTAGFRTEMLSHDAYISLPGAATLTIGNELLSCITHSFSRPSAPGGTSGALVYLPDGIGPESDVRGRIVVLDGIASPAAGLRATQAGAIGQIHVSPHEHKHEMCISSVWGSPSPETLGQLPGTVVVSIARADGARLQQRLLAGEAITAVITAEVETGWRKTPILVAEMAQPDADPEAPFVLFSGHHDTWYYGVMDNGSANATMMEVARLCATRRDQWRRGLRLCFWSGHSHGRYSGSSWYADQHWHELERRCVAHLNIDSTGGVGATVLTDVLTSSELRGMGGEAVHSQAGQDIVGMRMSRAGDQSFWGIGVPSMFMGMSEQSSETSINPTGGVLGGAAKRNGAGFGWWWHTPDDTIDKIDPVFLERDARVYVHTLWRLLSDDVLCLDYQRWAMDFQAELTRLQNSLGCVFDISDLQTRTANLASNAGALNAQAKMATTPAHYAAINQALMAVSRALVPIDYTNGDRFAHDPALGQSAWPPLDPIRRLAGASGDQARFNAVAATRARNRIGHALDQAIAALDAALAGRRT